MWTGNFWVCNLNLYMTEGTFLQPTLKQGFFVQKVTVGSRVFDGHLENLYII